MGDFWDRGPRLHHEQTKLLLTGLDPRRVKSLDGNSYLQTYDVRVWLNRVFGFTGWSLVTVSDPKLLFEQEVELKNGKPGYKVGYAATVMLTIHTNHGDSHYTGSAVGDASMPDYKRGDAHDMAMKSAESGALKRAASNLGDQFGLSLYNGGQTAPMVRKVWQEQAYITLQTDEPEPELHDEPEGSDETP